jgi:hypothetical protein
MPLPKPLKRGASKKAKRRRMAATMHDLKHGPHHKDRTRAQEIAIAYRQAGEKRKSKRTKRRVRRRSARR